MPRGEDVSQSSFPMDLILYDDGVFSIAWGRWERVEHSLGMRWNGSGTDPGYPKLFSNPVWFRVTPELTLPTLIGLLSSVHANKAAVATLIAELS